MRLPALFTDHLVLQREMPMPVWGWDEPGTTVTVTLDRSTAHAVADADGAWRVTLAAMPAGGPHRLVVTGTATRTLYDVMIGEVWLCSGQSNMEWAVIQARDGDREIDTADLPAIRLFTVPKSAVTEQQTDVAAAWTVCGPDTVATFSAVGFFFGRVLHQRLGVPIGLINASWSGTYAEAWISRAGLMAEPTLRHIVEAYEAKLPGYAAQAADHHAARAAWERTTLPTDTGNAGYAQGWAAPGAELSAWGDMSVPTLWQRQGHDYSGVFWFRREVEIPHEWSGRDLILRLGACDKADVTYFNNVEVGSLGPAERADAWCVPRVYTIPAALVHPGHNTLAVRICSDIYDGGFHGGPERLSLRPADMPEATPIPLAGTWQYRVEQNFGLITEPTLPPLPQGPGNPNSPNVLFNGMIAPLAPYGLRGAIWYQGESNVWDARAYQTLFPALIRDWRRAWGYDLAFYFVQLANFNSGTEQAGRHPWPELREAQTMTLALPHTGMAVAIDIGDPHDIHPTNKQDVGLRLALNALALTYGVPGVTYAGPMYAGMTIEGAALRLRFTHADGGLVARGDAPQGFEIAGADGRYVPAEARIQGDTVIVSAPDIAAPTAARYAWRDNPTCNLYNQAGLPASPFRTDDRW